MMDCIRRAWLDLYGDGTATVALEDPAAGYVCEELDLSFPEVREVVSNRPVRSGTDDRTAFYAGRAVSASIAVRTAPQPDTIAGLFAPYLVASARPVLHYVLDRPGAPERILTLRPANATWPISGKRARAIQLQWVAPDPIAKDPVTRTVTAWRGASVSPGRVYPLTFNRTYPPGGGSAQIGIIIPAGDVPIRPLLRFYGPVTDPMMTLRSSTAPTINYVMYFRIGYVIPAGSWVDVDTDAKTVFINSDPARPDHSALDWTTTVWPVLTGGRQWWLQMGGSSTTGVTQVQAIYQEGFLL